MIKRGEVYWASLDPTIGAEMKKTRPVLVVSNDLNNLHAPTVTILPITGVVEKIYPFEVALKPGSFGNRESSKVKADQVRTIDKRRLGRSLGMIPADLLGKVEQALRLHLSL